MMKVCSPLLFVMPATPCTVAPERELPNVRLGARKCHKRSFMA